MSDARQKTTALLKLSRDALFAGAGLYNKSILGALTLCVFVVPAPANSAPLCAIVADSVAGKILVEQGDCRTRVTPASTFKISLAVIGFEKGYLEDEHNPALPYKEGYVAWGGDNWKQPTDPTRWMKYSVVWYSQIMTRMLGEKQLTDYALKFGFGNADFTGDPGEDNGLDRAWIGSSLKVSPFEQTVFLRRLMLRQLPASERAMIQASKIVEMIPAANGWEFHGKTGGASRGKTDGAHGYGWYVGWAIKGGRTLVFAYLTQDQGEVATPAGIRAREALFGAWPSLVP